MATSKVYYTSMRTRPDDSIPAKLARLVKAAGLGGDVDVTDKLVAIKAHFGEYGNVSFLKPAYLRTLAQEVKAAGGKPFATDCSTLYVGMRNNALEHLECAALNGFNRDSVGCEIIISDGLRGDDEVEVPVPAPEGVERQLDTAIIGRGILDADLVITLTHAKGCNAAAYGGALKNLSMGCASKAGKMVMHSKGMPRVIEDGCIGCKLCLQSCGQDAIDIVDGKAHINDNCVGCGHCISYCPRKTIIPAWHRVREDMQVKMAEYASAVVAAQDCFHVAIAIDITLQCDCFAGNDAPIVPNVGMFASCDPVALDRAVTDRICAAPMITDSALPGLHDACEQETDHLHAINPTSDWELCIKHAEELGAGTREYELVEVK